MDLEFGTQMVPRVESVVEIEGRAYVEKAQPLLWGRRGTLKILKRLGQLFILVLNITIYF